MKKEPIDLKKRTKDFTLRIIRLYTALPRNAVAQVLGKQILKSGTSVGAHYREGMRSRSKAEYISKLEGGLQELEETIYWLELIVEAEVMKSERIDPLMDEAKQLNAILTTCVKKTKSKKL
jgi:four helix bundle protein